MLNSIHYCEPCGHWHIATDDPEKYDCPICGSTLPQNEMAWIIDNISEKFKGIKENEIYNEGTIGRCVGSGTIFLDAIRILTIRKLNFSGKYVEFWFEEDRNVSFNKYFNKETDDFVLCCKSGDLQKAVEDSGLGDDVFWNGYNKIIGKTTKWVRDSHNTFFLDGFVLPTGYTIQGDE